MNNHSLAYCFFAILGCLSLIISCTPKQESAENNIEFDTIRVSRVYHLDNDSTQPSCNIKIDFIYPVSYKGSEETKTLQKAFLSNFFDKSYSEATPQEAIERYTENYINNYKEDARIFLREKENHYSEEGVPDNYFSYYEKLSNEITFNKSDFVSFRINQTNFKGGGNSFQQYTNFVYDLKNGKILGEEDIFKEGYERVLNVIFKNKLLAANKVENIRQLEDLGYFGIEEITPNDNFLLDEKGITYTFNKGEYSALQLNEINIFIPYNELTNVLTENSPVHGLPTDKHGYTFKIFSRPYRKAKGAIYRHVRTVRGVER